MSYEIYFIKKTNLNPGNVWRILEADVSETDEHYLSQPDRDQITKELQGLGIKFELFRSPNHIELNADTYQISIFDSQIALSIPYWEDNQSTDIDKQIKEITNLLLDNSFIGFDAQTGQFIKGEYQSKETFTEAKEVFDKGLHQQRQTTGSSRNWTYIGLGLGVLIIILIVWLIVKK